MNDDPQRTRHHPPPDDEESAGASSPSATAPVRTDGGSYAEDPLPKAERRSLPLAPGAALGVAAFVATYAVMYTVRSGKLASALGAFPFQFSASAPDTTQVVGWLVYRAHFVPVELDLSGLTDVDSLPLVSGVGSLPGTFEQLARAIDPGLLFTVPCLALFIAGFYTAIEVDATSVRQGALAGTTIVTGYLALVAVAVVLVTWTVTQSLVGVSTLSASIAPSTVRAVLVAGVCYPVVLGGLGGAVAGRLTDWRIVE